MAFKKTTLSLFFLQLDAVCFMFPQKHTAEMLYAAL